LRRSGRLDKEGGGLRRIIQQPGPHSLVSLEPEMLTAGALGMLGYGLYSAGLGLAGLLGLVVLDVWADLVLVLLGLLLALSAALVRVRFPGGLALALSAMLSLQALALHNDLHFYGRIVPLLQALRGAYVVLLLVLAYVGSHRRSAGDSTTAADKARS
jgi:hypothetical protein